jgi:hypothetical protein
VLPCREFNRRAADIILAAPTTWSTTIMTDNRETCVDPYLDSFAQSFAILVRIEDLGEDEANGED